MIEKLKEIFLDLGINSSITNFLVEIIMIIIMFICIFILYKLIKGILKVVVERYIKNNKYKWDDVLIKRKITDKVANLSVAIITSVVIPIFQLTYTNLIEKIISIYIICIITYIIATLFSCVNDIYNNFQVSKSKPIKGIIQVIQIVVYVFGAIIVISSILNQSPVIILSGLGALSAVAMLVFKDSLLGLVAGIQIAANNMVKIGDWIDVPNLKAEGTVSDISLNTITIENFDKTVTSIPAYSLISNSFKNYKGMEKAGVRRIKRAIHIDMNSVKFCDEKMLDRFKKVNYLTDYIKSKEKDIEEYNSTHKVNNNEVINLRRLTNIGTFRVYIKNYLKYHPKISSEATLLVRQLDPDDKGIPIEIYVFVSETDWMKYEDIQSDIFDHIYSIAKEFDIRISQDIVGSDFERIKLK